MGDSARKLEYDEQRDRLIEAQGFRVLRFWDNQVFQETQAVLEQIMRALGLVAPIPNLPPQAEEGNKCAGRHPPPLAGEN